ncbi:MAG: glycosyltransferase [Oscillospiraceae bacterium]|nr:glycosyltransferase [Oscillospiraceae bacterium]
MPVYFKDNPEWLKIAVDSMLAQTLPPEEIVIAVDGAVTSELENVIGNYETNSVLFSVYRFAENEGLGLLLRKAIPLCRNEYVARMDADDFSVPSRLEKQFDIIKKGANLVGSSVYEFIGETGNIISLRAMPEKHEHIIKFSKKRAPVAHPSALFRKQDVIDCGNYEDNYLVEDYDIFVKLLRHGVRAYNIQEPLVYMRINSDFYKRRGGIKFLKSLLAFNKKLYKNGWTGLNDYFMRSLFNIIVCLMPNFLRDFIYRKLLRKTYKKD